MIVPRLGTVDDMTVNIPGNNIDLDIPTVMNVEKQLVAESTPDSPTLLQCITDGKDILCFIAYRGANTLRPQ